MNIIQFSGLVLLSLFIVAGCVILLFDSGMNLIGSETHSDYVNNLFAAFGSLLLIGIMIIPAIAFMSGN